MLAEKRYIWHPLLKEKAVENRLYQNRILERARQCNTLVVLPTALVKTVIALLLAIEKAEEGKIFFLAPTRPLVQQHHQTFLEKHGLTKLSLRLLLGVIRQTIEPPYTVRLRSFSQLHSVFGTT